MRQLIKLLQNTAEKQNDELFHIFLEFRNNDILKLMYEILIIHFFNRV